MCVCGLCAARFLRYSPYSEARAFKHLIKDKIADAPEVGYKFLQAVLQVGLGRGQRAGRGLAPHVG